MDGYYRLIRPTTGISADSANPTTISLPAESSVCVMGVCAADNRFTEVLWGEERLRIFSDDFQAAAQQIPIRRFNAAGKEIPGR